MGVVLTVADVVTDNKRYYNCPRCNRRVWAYGSFVDTICLDCPGTVLSAVGSTANMATFEATRGATAIANRTVVSPVTSLVRSPIDAVTRIGNGAKYKGTIVWIRSKGSTTCNKLTSSNLSERITNVTTKSCGILSGVVDITVVSHWWMNIETNSNYYQIQFRKCESQIQLRKCSYLSDCDETGLAEGNRAKDVQPITERSYSGSVSRRTMRDLIKYIENNVDSSYSLLFNNCQGLCKGLYRWL